MNILSHEQLIKEGIEFTDDVCFSGVFGQQIFTKEEENGGKPVNGIIYELNKKGKIAYYTYYLDGIPNGENVEFYENGNIKSYCNMKKGAIDGDYIEWYETGEIKLKKNSKYGIIFWSKEFDREGNILREKKELNDDEKKLYEKFVVAYEHK